MQSRRIRLSFAPMASEGFLFGRILRSLSEGSLGMFEAWTQRELSLVNPKIAEQRVAPPVCAATVPARNATRDMKLHRFMEAR
jgi:hypothetical protein